MAAAPGRAEAQASTRVPAAADHEVDVCHRPRDVGLACKTPIWEMNSSMKGSEGCWGASGTRGTDISPTPTRKPCSLASDIIRHMPANVAAHNSREASILLPTDRVRKRLALLPCGLSRKFYL